MIQQKILSFNTSGRGTIDITAKIAQLVEQTRITTGICNVFLHHTSASLIFCENADSTVQQDLENFVSRWIPEDAKYFKHNNEGSDDMPAHLRTIMTQSSLTIPITQRKLALGTWQGIFLWEHRHSSFHRKMTITLIGE